MLRGILMAAGVMLSAAANAAVSAHAQEVVTSLQPVPAFAGTTPTASSPPTTTPPAAIPLNSGWMFLADPHDVGLDQAWAQGGAADSSWHVVAIPNDLNPVVNPAGNTRHVGWYQLRFQGPAVAAGRSWAVSFEGVRRHAMVWLNGQPIGANSDPYTPFSLPATSLVPNGPNVLSVRVDNSEPANTLPEDWWNWAAISGPVALEPMGRLSIDGLAAIPQLGCAYRCGQVLIEGSATNSTGSSLPARVRVTLRGPDGRKVTIRHRLPAIAPGASERFSFRVAVPAPVTLWSPQHPALYATSVQLRSEGRVEQQRALNIGMRSVQVRGGALYLNGTRVWLHGAAIHEDVDGHGAALTDKDIQTLVAQLKQAHANITRAHYLLSPRLLDALDAAGIMVWEQPPVDHADGILKSASGRARALAALADTVAQARNHPSVVVDSVGNELTATPDSTPGTNAYLSQAIALARGLNPTVPVALDIYCYPGFARQSVYAKLDVIGISDYYGWYNGPPRHSIANFSGLAPYLRQLRTKYPRQALVISEYGAEGFYNGSPNVKGTYEFQSNYIRDTLETISQLRFMSGSIYWTLREFAVGPKWTGGATLPNGVSPSGIHHKGLIAYDGAYKPAFAVAAKLFPADPSFAR